MFPKRKWLWTSYCFLLLYFIGREAYYLFVPTSETSLYYLILRAFDPVFYIAYSAYIIRLLLNFIHCLPLLLYTYRIRFLPPKFWQYLFILRCLFEIIGNSDELTALSALSHARPGMIWIAVIILLLPYVPSYLVCYWYAFRQDKIFA